MASKSAKNYFLSNEEIYKRIETKTYRIIVFCQADILNVACTAWKSQKLVRFRKSSAFFSFVLNSARSQSLLTETVFVFTPKSYRTSSVPRRPTSAHVCRVSDAKSCVSIEYRFCSGVFPHFSGQLVRESGDEWRTGGGGGEKSKKHIRNISSERTTLGSSAIVFFQYFHFYCFYIVIVFDILQILLFTDLHRLK